MNKYTAISQWLDAVDQRLRASRCLMVARQLAKHTNTVVFNQSGLLTAWPSVQRLAVVTGLSERAVHYAIKDLEAAGCLAIRTGGGRGHSNHYLLALQTLQSVAPFQEPKPCNPLHPLNGERVQAVALKGANSGRERVQAVAPELIDRTISRTFAAAEVETGGPSERAGAFGPPPGIRDAIMIETDEGPSFISRSALEAQQRAKAKEARTAQRQAAINEAVREAEQHLVSIEAMAASGEFSALKFEWPLLDRLANDDDLPEEFRECADELLHLIAVVERNGTREAVMGGCIGTREEKHQ